MTLNQKTLNFLIIANLIFTLIFCIELVITTLLNQYISALFAAIGSSLFFILFSIFYVHKLHYQYTKIILTEIKKNA